MPQSAVGERQASIPRCELLSKQGFMTNWNYLRRMSVCISSAQHRPDALARRKSQTDRKADPMCFSATTEQDDRHVRATATTPRVLDETSGVERACHGMSAPKLILGSSKVPVIE